MSNTMYNGMYDKYIKVSTVDKISVGICALMTIYVLLVNIHMYYFLSPYLNLYVFSFVHVVVVFLLVTIGYILYDKENTYTNKEINFVDYMTYLMIFFVFIGYVEAIRWYIIVKRNNKRYISRGMMYNG